jgi:hypothetical protein
MRVAHRHGDGRMPQQFFHRNDVRTSFQKACESVPQRVPRHSFDLCLLTGLPQFRLVGDSLRVTNSVIGYLSIASSNPQPMQVWDIGEW